MGKTQKIKTSRTKKGSDVARSQLEKDRRAYVNTALEKCKAQNPYVNVANIEKITKNESLRLISTFFKLAASSKYTSFIKNPHPATNLCLKYFNLKRSDLNCSFFLCDGATKVSFAHEDVFAQLGYMNIDIIGCDLMEKLVPPDEKEHFEQNLREARKKLLQAVNQNNGKTDLIRQPFEFTCRLLHKQNGKSITQHRSTVLFSGSMRFSEGVSQDRFSRKKNGHMSIKELDIATSSISLDQQIEIIGQIQIKPNDFRLTFVAFHKAEYVLFMKPDGSIIWADHRIIGVIGYHPKDVINKHAHAFINDADLKVALYAQMLLLKRPNGNIETVLRLLTCTRALVFIKSFGVLYNTNSIYKTIFKLNALKIEYEAEGISLIEKEHQRLPESIKKKSIEDLQKEFEKILIDYGNQSAAVDDQNNLSIDQMKDAHLTSSSESLSDGEFVTNIKNSPHQTTMNQLMVVKSSQLFANSLSPTLHQNGQPDNSSSIIDQSIVNNQNITQTVPITMSNSLIYSYIPMTSVIATDQTKFMPNQYHQLLNLPSPVPSTPQLIQTTLNNDHVFIHNINININNNNNSFILYNNNNQHQHQHQLQIHQQHFDGDYHHHHLPTEGAFVNLIPYLENDSTSTDLIHTNPK